MKGMVWLLCGVGLLVGVCGAIEASLSYSLSSNPPLPAPSLGDLWSGGPMTEKNLMANLSGRWLINASWDGSGLLGWEWDAPMTYPMTSEMSTVRILGGWAVSEGIPQPQWFDVVYRNPENNSLVFRWETLWNRLDPIVRNEINPVLVLDNVPYALAKDGGERSVYGQVLGPSNATEYSYFVSDLVSGVLGRYGAAEVGSWVWRVATEPNTRPGHWNGTNEEWMAMYSAAVEGVRRVLPNATVGPGNFCPFNLPSGCVGTYETIVKPIMEYIATKQLPIDFVAASYYGSFHGDNNSYAPNLGGRSALGLQTLKSLSPRFKDLPMLFYEYGTLGNAAHNVSQEPGVFGGAFKVASSASATALGVQKLFHWGGIDWAMNVLSEQNGEGGAVHREGSEAEKSESGEIGAVFVEESEAMGGIIGTQNPILHTSTPSTTHNAAPSPPSSSQPFSPTTPNFQSTTATPPKWLLYESVLYPAILGHTARNAIRPRVLSTAPSTTPVDCPPEGLIIPGTNSPFYPLSSFSPTPQHPNPKLPSPFSPSVCVLPTVGGQAGWSVSGFGAYLPAGVDAGFAPTDSLFLLLSTFHTNRSASTPLNLTVTLDTPQEWAGRSLGDVLVRGVWWTRESNPWDAIHDKGRELGWLKNDDDLVYSIADMLTHFGLEQARLERLNWLELQDALYAPSKLQNATVKCDPQTCTVTLKNLPPHSMWGVWINTE